MQSLVAGLCGIVFGAGLAISGMTNPAKVLAFLDLFGRWDPTLAIVMGGALLVSATGFALARRRARPWLSENFAIPTLRDVDVPLIGGAALFGVGWGLVGLCPGPALASLSRGSPEVALFVAAMISGVLVLRLAARPRASSPTQKLSTSIVLTLAALALLGSGCNRKAFSAEIPANEVLAGISDGAAPLILDVRTPEEFAAGRVPGALNISIDELAQRIDEIADQREQEVVVYCERGPRAARASLVLAKAGFVAVRHLEGDMSAWRAAGLPIDR